MGRILFLLFSHLHEHDGWLYHLDRTIKSFVKSIGKCYNFKEENDISQQLQDVSNIFSVPISQIQKIVKRFKKETVIKTKIDVKDLKEASNDLFNKWKKQQKGKKQQQNDRRDYQVRPFSFERKSQGFAIEVQKLR